MCGSIPTARCMAVRFENDPNNHVEGVVPLCARCLWEFPEGQMELLAELVNGGLKNLDPQADS